MEAKKQEFQKIPERLVRIRQEGYDKELSQTIDTAVRGCIDHYLSPSNIEHSMRRIRIGERELYIFRERSRNKETGELTEKFEILVFDGERLVDSQKNKTKVETGRFIDELIEKYKDKV